MEHSPLKEGKVQFDIPARAEPCQTYYKIYGDLSSNTAPLIVLHGGPGSGHEYVEPFSDIWHERNVPVILYDQIGCGKSTHLPETLGDRKFWVPSLFVAELDNLIGHLDLERTGYHILGHSWGGTLACAFASRQPPGLERLILVGANAEMRLLKQNLWNLLKRLPLEHQKAVEEAVEKSDFDGEAYKAARAEFMQTYLCRARPFPPPELALDMKNHAADETVRLTMQGKCPWVYDGSNGSWSNIPLLPKIKAPTLVINGEYDTAQDLSTLPFFNHIPKVRWVTLAGASHMGHLDSPEMRGKTMKLVGEFLLP